MSLFSLHLPDLQCVFPYQSQNGFQGSPCLRPEAGAAQITNPHLPSLQLQLARSSLPLALNCRARVVVWVGVGKYLWIQRWKHDAGLAGSIHDPRRVGGLEGYDGSMVMTEGNGLSCVCVWVGGVSCCLEVTSKGSITGQTTSTLLAVILLEGFVTSPTEGAQEGIGDSEEEILGRKGGTQHLNPALPTLQRCRVPAADK